MTSGIDYTGTRYMDLAEMLSRWGYEVVPDPDVSSWNEKVRAAPLTGFVLMRGEKTLEDVELIFNIRESWQEGVEADRTVRQGASLVRYHYHGQSGEAGMRFCLFAEGHPNMPFHRHPFGVDTKAEIADPIDPEAALSEFEGTVYLELGGDVD